MTKTHRTEHHIPLFVESNRLVIRPTNLRDLPYLQRWWNDPVVMDASGEMDGMQYDLDDMHEWYRRHVENRNPPHHFMICLRNESERPIGEFYIASQDRPGCVTFGLLIGDTTQWGHGYTLEAILAYADALFECDHCTAMRLETPVNNKHLIELCESIGFEVEHVWANGHAQTMILTEAAFRNLHFS